MEKGKVCGRIADYVGESVKYNNKKTVVDGIKFDSIGESRRYKELKLLEKAKVISHLELQPKFELQPRFKKNGKTYRPITYIADFRYEENGKMIVEDFKGMRTNIVKLKLKMFEYKYPNLTILETN